MVFILGHGAGLGSRGASRWLWLATLGCSVWASLLWAGASFDTKWVYPVRSDQVIIMSPSPSCGIRLLPSTHRRRSGCFDLREAGVAGGVLATSPLARLPGVARTSCWYRVCSTCADPEPALLPFREDDETLRILVDCPTRDGIQLILSLPQSSRWRCRSFYLAYFPFSESVAAPLGRRRKPPLFWAHPHLLPPLRPSCPVTDDQLFVGRSGLVLTLMIPPSSMGLVFPKLVLRSSAPPSFAARN
jgi:hypothetical protein